jgi:hypothetical protein
MEVTTAMVADAAALADGKLYINGGGWNTIFTAKVPTTHPALALVLIFKLSWHEANEDMPVLIELMDEDGQPSPLRGEGTFRVAAPPFVKKGVDLYQSFAQMFYAVTFENLGLYRFRISSNGKDLASIPIHVLTMPGVRPTG